MEVTQVAAVPEGDRPLPRKTTSGGAALRFRHENNAVALPGVCEVALRVTAGKPTPHGRLRATTLHRHPRLLPASTHDPGGTNFLVLEMSVGTPVP